MTELPSICKIDDCKNPVRTHGLCNAHYCRFLTHGDPLGGQPTMKGQAYAFIHDTAIPFSGDDCLIWPFAKNARGYARLARNGKFYQVSRLVCEAIHGSPPSSIHQAAHSCGKGHLGCISPAHLFWKTPAENAADKELHGTVTRGERQKSKLKSADVLRIRDLAKTKPQSEIAAEYGVSRSLICMIASRRVWAWLQPASLNSY